MWVRIASDLVVEPLRPAQKVLREHTSDFISASHEVEAPYRMEPSLIREALFGVDQQRSVNVTEEVRAMRLAGCDVRASVDLFPDPAPLTRCPAHALQARWLQSAASTAGLENDSADDVVMILMMLCFFVFFQT